MEVVNFILFVMLLLSLFIAALKYYFWLLLAIFAVYLIYLFITEGLVDFYHELRDLFRD